MFIKTEISCGNTVTGCWVGVLMQFSFCSIMLLLLPLSGWRTYVYRATGYLRTLFGHKLCILCNKSQTCSAKCTTKVKKSFRVRTLSLLIAHTCQLDFKATRSKVNNRAQRPTKKSNKFDNIRSMSSRDEGGRRAAASRRCMKPDTHKIQSPSIEKSI